MYLAFNKYQAAFRFGTTELVSEARDSFDASEKIRVYQFLRLKMKMKYLSFCEVQFCALTGTVLRIGRVS